MEWFIRYDKLVIYVKNDDLLIPFYGKKKEEEEGMKKVKKYGATNEPHINRLREQSFYLKDFR